MSVLGIDPAAVPGAICAGVAATALVLTASPPRRRLGPRVHDYSVVARSKLGSGPSALSLAEPAPPALPGAVARVVGPMVTSIVRVLAALGAGRDDAELARQLVQAGAAGATPRQYRRQQVALAALGAIGGGVLGGLAGFGPKGIVVVSGFGLVWGLIWKRSELERRIARRRERMRAELFSVCQILAVYARVTPNLQTIAEEVTRRSRGEMAAELRRVLNRIEAGTQPETAFAELADLTAEPAAARLYRTMATAAASGGDIADALLAQSEDLRDARREDYKRRATRRRLAMVGGIVVQTVPLILFVVAAAPRLVFGR